MRLDDEQRRAPRACRLLADDLRRRHQAHGPEGFADPRLQGLGRQARRGHRRDDQRAGDARPVGEVRAEHAVRRLRRPRPVARQAARRRGRRLRQRRRAALRLDRAAQAQGPGAGRRRLPVVRPVRRDVSPRRPADGARRQRQLPAHGARRRDRPAVPALVHAQASARREPGPADERRARSADRGHGTAFRIGTARSTRHGTAASAGATTARQRGEATMAPGTRIEHDLLGDREIPADAYYGVHTLRALENFPITGTPISIYPELVRALAGIKQAAARALLRLAASYLITAVGDLLRELVAAAPLLAQDADDGLGVVVVLGEDQRLRQLVPLREEVAAPAVAQRARDGANLVGRLHAAVQLFGRVLEVVVELPDR